MKNMKELETIGQQIKNALESASIKDGLKRTQRWLSTQTEISEVDLSNKIAGYKDFKSFEIDRINKVLSTDFSI